ncbi:MAG: ATPase [Gammaproteobacteria bacterium RIFCSPHIGHO2_12_FULL_42_13]|nr:MAG: ATPase [Gammaproteobacteria bacterium RIFCSPHIGHO2_12_FULL_42_13]
MIFQDVTRSFNEPEQSYFLSGPRGTGKSTLITHRHPNALIINLLSPSEKQSFFATPEKLLEIVRATSNGHTIVIDEIQKAPELLSLVHMLIEEKRGWRFILTGSSARKLKQAGTDLLGGRALKKTLHPFMASELKEQFNFVDALQFGLLPLRFTSPNPLEMLTAYVSLYLDEEVKAEGYVRRIEPFARFLTALSFSHGSLLNISNISREASIKRNTVDNWLSIVEDLLITYTIPVFSKRAKRALIAQSKLYFFDVGVYRALRPQSILDSASEMDGASLEGLIAQHLRAWIDYTKARHVLYFWRTKSGVEVDFVVFGDMGLWAIEVKNSEHIHPHDLRSLKNFYEDYPEATLIFLYRGKQRLLKDNILCIPCNIFLKALSPNQPIEST